MDEIEDAMKLRLTKIRLNNLDRRNKKLVDIVASSVMNNIIYYFFHAKGRGMFSKIPLVLREHLLRVLEKQEFYYITGASLEVFKKRLQAFKILLHDAVKELDVSAIMSFCPYDYRLTGTVGVLRIIGKKVPKIESLRMNNCANGVTLLSDDQFFDVLGKLSELTRLEIHTYQIDFMDLMNLCGEKLKNLQYLVACNLIILENRLETYVVDFRRSFSNLRVFIFSLAYDVHDSADEYRQLIGQIWRLGLLHLPNLKIIHQFANVLDEGEEDLRITELPSQPPPLLHLRTKPTTLGLHLAYPAVTDLMIDWSEWTHDAQEVNAMLQFPKIECLNFKNIPSSELIDRFLINYGGNLKHLILNDAQCRGIEVRFSTILDSCSNLEVLSLNHMDVVDHSTLISNFAKLKNLEWLPHEARAVCLSKILAAPQLERFVMRGKSYDKDDLELVSRQIAEGQILSQLTTFKYFGTREIVPFNTEEPEVAEYVRFLLALGNLIKNASAYLPHLTNVYVDYYFDQGVELFTFTQYSGSHVANYYNRFNADAIEHIGDKTIVRFLGVFNRRKYVSAHTFAYSHLNNL